MKNRIVLLGTGTCQLQPKRMASSALIEWDGIRVVYDMGRGITNRLVEVGLRHDDVEHIVLSHFHPDHISDLIPFLHAACWSRIDPRSKDLHIYGPLGVKVQIMRLLSLFGADEIIRPHFDVHIHEIRNGSIEIGPKTFDFVSLPPAGNHGLRFESRGRHYAFTGDSSFHNEEVEFLKEVDVAVFDSGHLTEEQIIELAASSQPKELICSHLYQELDAADLERKGAALGFRGRFVVGHDLMELPIA